MAVADVDVGEAGGGYHLSTSSVVFMLAHVGRLPWFTLLFMGRGALMMSPRSFSLPSTRGLLVSRQPPLSSTSIDNVPSATQYSSVQLELGPLGNVVVEWLVYGRR